MNQDKAKAARAAVTLALALHLMVLALALVWLVIQGLVLVAFVGLAWISVHSFIAGALGYTTAQAAQAEGGLL